MMDQTTQAENGRTFHLFSRLPAELRWKIWEYSLPSPRLVPIRCGSDDLGCSSSSSSSSSLSSFSFTGCTSPALIPANLHASHESRREALRHYHAAFGISHRPGQIFFSASSDILYFGPRDGFMASEAQLRTVLMLCDPADLARVQKAAVNDAVFCVTAAADSTKVAISLLVDVLLLLRARMPGLRELVFVPQGKSPLYNGDVCLVEPAIVQSRLARIVKEAMLVVFGDQRPWNWRVMALSPPAPVPAHSRQVADWDTAKEQEDVRCGNAHGLGYIGPGREGEKPWVAKGRELTRLNLLQDSMRRQFTQMDVGAHAFPVVVE
ncbi:hypothetical protein N0V93_005545 [Gnomoniopsis smithogilvyi]|uniref:2EXR domain-containing protein n=1 Tax=Gnomoniopsis smithogilvyi TaxID=1191159 RepID=A0A9W9CY51_9PEZI|nr:hypothetical protein N0V93_005545 [Gnomoniopsis smithogilvyi]